MPDVIAGSDVILAENVSVQMYDDFAKFLRGYPFIERTRANVEVLEFESGVEQRRDIWGRMKKEFEINFPPMTKSEMEEVRNFYVERVGPSEVFQFTSPLDNKIYKVRFIEGSLEVERRHFDTYFGRVTLVEVF